ncbi:MAG: sodium-translocating pyrophosphatase [Candidatus Lambdaproteobacteria bacterium RIFOXYD2_FULL_50_16]|uniref:Putative K(+)-stimulated pyrophosphate-energized sodium pump n=1 Tax=Candidatus Lambdaproteobacteria bacterium RIFOXYD2_FULL_50_16 TaxID=1817772 RepID=A0A1F6GA61_9PROT|nr:MAG: sodium-translocating pyrophosphatase [Candidatus Lambdaproteobacteria bacterium RIFOXYD2_FULL_50_16]
MEAIGIILVFASLSVLVALFKAKKITSIAVDAGADTVEEGIKLTKIHKAIADGAIAFLTQSYKAMFAFIAGFSVLIVLVIDDPHTLTVNEGVPTAISFVLGSLTSILAGFIGMKIATAGNVRTAGAAKTDISKAFGIALDSGAVMGFALVGLALFGLVGILFLLKALFPDLDTEENRHILMEVMAGFGLGGSSIALFARVGGGIYTKAADVGADLVGKVEAGIPEDDPRNPAVIADNVGDNVGDVAGMGADLFGSCAESTCAAMVIGAVAFAANFTAMIYPILISAVGVPVALLTFLFVKVKTAEDVAPNLKRMLIVSTLMMAAVMYALTVWALPENFELLGHPASALGIYFCFLSGLVAGLVIGLATEYFTSHDYKPTRNVAKASETGAATNIIAGLALGYYSAGIPIVAVVLSIAVSYHFGGMYGVAVAALGMLGTLIIGLTIDGYGPVSDNAGGIAEMAGLGKEIRDRTDVLDAAGNTTAAIGKGFAIGSAILTSLALFAAFLTRANGLFEEQGQAGVLDSINLLDPLVLSGLFIGALLPFLFSAMTMEAVGSAAMEMIVEVRRQFREIPGILEGTADPDYKTCVAISTVAALKKTIAPAALIIVTPLGFGFLFGIQALAGLLAGSLVCGGVLAIASSNSGGAWDNAKKYIEKGEHGGKGSDAHKAAVVGDTVGDPCKDTSGPSLNILLKLQAILSLVFVPFFVHYGGWLVKLVG